MARKKKIKIKKKNFCLFILSLILITTVLYKGTTKIFTTITYLNDKKEQKNKNDDIKLNKLDNIDEKIDFFNKKYINRYLKYKKNNPKLSNKDIVIHVNIGLDNEFYTHTKKAPNQYKNTVLVNKYNYLSKYYEPKDLENINIQYARSGMKLVEEAKEQYEAMAKAAQNDNLKLVATSSYRSYEYQEELYNDYVKKDGKEAADTYSGRPGFSEHQTGLAVDLHNGKKLYTEFESTKEYKWMQKNAHKYGFILRFPKDKENITGYEYESWHYRYVGQKIATYIHDNNLCFEEYYAMYLDKK